MATITVQVPDDLAAALEPLDGNLVIDRHSIEEMINAAANELIEDIVNVDVRGVLISGSHSVCVPCRTGSSSSLASWRRSRRPRNDGRPDGASPRASVSPGDSGIGRPVQRAAGFVIAVLDDVIPQFGDLDEWKWGCVEIRRHMAESIELSFGPRRSGHKGCGLSDAAARRTSARSFRPGALSCLGGPTIPRQGEPRAAAWESARGPG